jgi:hypothetical protein
MLFIGDGCKLHIPKERLVPDIFIYEKNVNPTRWGGQGCSRCSDSYLVSKKCAKQLCDYIANTTKKIGSPIDFWLNEAGRDNNFNVYWAEPTIVTQGSQNGLYATSL